MEVKTAEDFHFCEKIAFTLKVNAPQSLDPK